MTLGDYLALWLDTYIAAGRSQSTYTGYQQALRHLADDTRGAALVAPALPMMLQRDIYMLAAKYSRQAQILYAVLHCACVRAVRMGYMANNPMDRVDKPQHRPRVMRWLSQRQLMAYMDAAADSPAYVRLALLAVCGLRRGEALAITPDDVDLARQMLLVRRQVLRGVISPLKTPTSHRDIPLEDGMLRLLRGRDDYGTTSATVLAREHGKVLQAAGLPHVTLHEMRHTCATTMIGAGVPMMVVQHYLGHSGYQITADTYGHVAVDDLRRAAQVFGSVVGSYQQMMAL